MPCLHPKWVVIRRKSDLVDGDGNAYYKPVGFEDLPELKFVKVPCHNCYECRKRRANDWRLRLFHEWRYGGYNLSLFTTISFSPENYPDMKTVDRSSCRKLMRRFWDAFRKRYGYIPRYFFITEYNEDPIDPTNNHRFHFHGFIFFRLGQPCPPYVELHEFIGKYFGYSWFEKMESTGAISYTLKYATKGLTERVRIHPASGIIVSSQGIGKSYVRHIGPVRILGRVDSVESPTRIKVLDDRGHEFTYSIPQYYKQLSRRLTNSHKIAVVRQLQSYVVRYGPYHVYSDASPKEISETIAKYEEWLSSMSDNYNHYVKVSRKRKRVRKALRDRHLSIDREFSLEFNVPLSHEKS